MRKKRENLPLKSILLFFRKVRFGHGSLQITEHYLGRFGEEVEEIEEITKLPPKK